MYTQIQQYGIIPWDAISVPGNLLFKVLNLWQEIPINRENVIFTAFEDLNKRTTEYLFSPSEGMIKKAVNIISWSGQKDNAASFLVPLFATTLGMHFIVSAKNKKTCYLLAIPVLVGETGIINALNKTNGSLPTRVVLGAIPLLPCLPPLLRICFKRIEQFVQERKRLLAEKRPMDVQQTIPAKPIDRARERKINKYIASNVAISATLKADIQSLLAYKGDKEWKREDHLEDAYDKACNAYDKACNVSDALGIVRANSESSTNPFNELVPHDNTSSYANYQTFASESFDKNKGNQEEQDLILTLNKSFYLIHAMLSNKKISAELEILIEAADRIRAQKSSEKKG